MGKGQKIYDEITGFWICAEKRTLSFKNTSQKIHFVNLSWHSQDESGIPVYGSKLIVNNNPGRITHPKADILPSS